jgi:molecular chaperone HscC
MIIGIDLGTTNSLVAVWRDGKPQIIPNALGDNLTPSCIGLDKDGTILVGKAARERLQTHPHMTASLFKRYMGSDKRIRLGDKEFRPEELSSMLLRALKEDAEAFLGHKVEEAIITVPAYFSDGQRKATRAAGQLAGLKVERLLNEPTAAALAYGIQDKEQESKFLVFDPRDVRGRDGSSRIHRRQLPRRRRLRGIAVQRIHGAQRPAQCARRRPHEGQHHAPFA